MCDRSDKKVSAKSKLLVALFCVLLLGVCSLQKFDNDESVAVTTNSVKFNGTAFWFNGIEYDVSDIDENVNAINDCHQIGNHIIIQGHVGPKNNIYLVFNTETEIFEKKIIG